MARIVTPSGVFDSVTPDNEKTLEDAIVANARFIFGEGRHYLNCKRRVGAKGMRFSIPDAFLVDLRRKDPRVYVVENELAVHDLFQHIGVQLLAFAHSYRQAGRQLKDVLFEEICSRAEVKDACEAYAREMGYRNLDNLVDHLVFKTPFQALVIIDERTEELSSVVKHFGFPVEVIEFVIHQDDSGNRAFSFLPFLQDVAASVSERSGEAMDVGDLDTIVVPAREEGFKETFLGENRWYAIRIHSSMIPQIKHIAAYQISPISAITHVASVSRIVPWEDTGKYCVDFAEPAREIGPIKLDKPGPGKAPQSPRYTSMAKLMQAKVLSDVF